MQPEALIRTPKEADGTCPRGLSATCSAPGTSIFYPTSAAIRACSSTPAASRCPPSAAYSPSITRRRLLRRVHEGFGREASDAVLEVGVTRALGLMARKFTMGANIEAAARRAMRAETYNPQRSHSFDMLGERQDV